MDGLIYQPVEKSQKELLEMFQKMKNSNLNNPDFYKVPVVYVEDDEKKETIIDLKKDLVTETGFSSLVSSFNNRCSQVNDTNPK